MIKLTFKTKRSKPKIRRVVRRSVAPKTTQTKIQESKLGWEKAPDVQRDVNQILNVLDLPYIKGSKIFCYRTQGSKSRSYARIWSFPKIFQDALGLEPAYVIEVLSKYYDKLDPQERIKVIIHELLHIPRNFSGALVPHVTQSRLLHKAADILFEEYKRKVVNK
jgi:predicted metallopeptidase